MRNEPPRVSHSRFCWSWPLALIVSLIYICVMRVCYYYYPGEIAPLYVEEREREPKPLYRGRDLCASGALDKNERRPRHRGVTLVISIGWTNWFRWTLVNNSHNGVFAARYTHARIYVCMSAYDPCDGWEIKFCLFSFFFGYVKQLLRRNYIYTRIFDSVINCWACLSRLLLIAQFSKKKNNLSRLLSFFFFLIIIFPQSTLAFISRIIYGLLYRYQASGIRIMKINFFSIHQIFVLATFKFNCHSYIYVCIIILLQVRR